MSPLSAQSRKKALRWVLLLFPHLDSNLNIPLQERRVLDYLNAYRSTGRPPVPCPPQPTDPAQRAALGYPPLFQPYIGVEGAPPPGPGVNVNGAGPSASTSTTGVVDFVAQVFRPTVTTEFGTSARFQSLVAQPEYSGYSPEVN